MPKQNCQQIYCKMVKDTDLYTVNAGAYTIAQAQTAYDAYIDAGYDQFDASTNHSLDVSGEAGDKIVIVWKSATAFVGEYQLRASYFAGKTVVILAVKLDGSDNVEAVGLRVNFNSFEAGQVDLGDVKFEGTEAFHYYRQYSSFNLTGISFKKCTCYWHRKAVLDITSLDCVLFYSYDSVTITCDQTQGLFDLKKVPIGIAGATTSLTILGLSADNGVKIGKYLYIPNNTTGYLLKIDCDTMTQAASLNMSNTGMTVCSDGKTIYAGNNSGRYVQKVNISDFTLSGSTVDIGSGNQCNDITTEGLSVYCVHNDLSTEKVIKIIISTEATSSLTLGTTSPILSTIITNGTYVFVGSVDAGCKLTVITIASFTQTMHDVSSTQPSSGKYYLYADETYLWLGNKGSAYGGLFKMTISSIPSGVGLNNGWYVAAAGDRMIIDEYNIGLSAYSIGYFLNSNNVMEAMDASGIFNTSFTMKNGLTYDGKYIYLIDGTSIRKVNYQYGPDLFEGFQALTMPSPSIIMANDYIKLELSKLRTRYFKPENSNVDQVRDYMVEEYDPEKEVNDSLKVFCGGYTKVIHRVAVTEGGITENDLDGVLCVSSSEKKIIGKKLYDNDGTTPYTFTALPHDENFLMLVTDPDGNYYVFSWYNDEIRDTWYSVTDDTVEYTIRRCFQLATRYGTEFDIANLENKVNSPLEASIVWNLQDNENIRK